MKLGRRLTKTMTTTNVVNDISKLSSYIRQFPGSAGAGYIVDPAIRRHAGRLIEPAPKVDVQYQYLMIQPSLSRRGRNRWDGLVMPGACIAGMDRGIHPI